MKKITMITLASALAMSSAAYAQTQNDEAVKSDVNAINQDNTAIQKHNAELQHDKDAAAADHANKAYGSEAADSAKAVGQKAAIETNKAEKSVHQKMLKHHKSTVKGEENDTNSSSSSTQQ